MMMLRMGEEQWEKMKGAYHGPAHEVVFHHEVFDERGVNLAHVFVICGFIKAWFLVGTYSPAEELSCRRGGGREGGV